ncbi:MAG: HDOD domain-containing protein [Spirochaetia bacterium]|nr:HDOD domain-containing protein [Spirochaetia bacterium]
MMESIYDKLEIPSMPQVVTRILEINENDITIGINQLEALISSDPNLVSKILKLANSPFYSRSNNITDLGRALSLLGFKSIKSLTLLVSVAKLLPNLSQNSATQKSLWMNSIIIAVTAKTLLIRLGHKNTQEKGFLGGLLRHIGQLILYSRFPSSYETALKQSSDGMDIKALQKYELHLFGVTTFSLSEYAMGKWNFPEEFIKITSINQYSIAETEKVAGLLGNIVCFAEIITYHRKLKETSLNKELTTEFEGLIEEYFKWFSVSVTDKNFIENGLQESFKNDEFYEFCEELFAL